MPKTATKEKPISRIPPSTKAELLERFKDYPGIKAWDRAYDAPAGVSSLPILLTDEQPDACVDSGHQNALKLGAVKCGLCGKPARQWYLRHVNTKQPGRVAQVRAKGLIPVKLVEIRQKDEISDLQESPDGLVHTGPNGARVLYKLPLDLYNERKRRERDNRDRRNSSAKHVREDLANDAGGSLGSEAADAIHDGLMYEETKHHTTLQDEAAGIGRDDE